MRKRFLFQIYSTRYKISGGRDQRCRIYQEKKNELLFIGTCGWNTASYYGATTEVFQWLMDRGFIPKHWYKSSERPGHAGGYYYGEVEKHYSIKEIEL